MLPTRPRPGRRAASLGAIALLVLLPLAILHPSAMGDRVYQPFALAANPPTASALEPEQLQRLREESTGFATEIPSWILPDLDYAAEELAQGRLPQWNPYERQGAVLVHGAMGTWHPTGWLPLWTERPVDGLVWTAWLHYALAGLLTFGMLRQLGLGIPAALFGAVCWSLSGPMAVNGYYMMRQAVLVWFPGLLWAALRLAQAPPGRRTLPGVALAVATGCSILPGFPPYTITAHTMLAGWMLFLLVRLGREEGRGAAWSLARTFATAWLVGVLLGSIYLFPAAGFFPLTERYGSETLSRASGGALSWWGLTGFAAPDLFGHPFDRSIPVERPPLAAALFRQTDWTTGAPLQPSWNPLEYAAFAGSLTVPLAVLGALAPGGRSRGFALVGLLLSLCLATGVGPFRLIYELPVFGRQTPMRFLPAACLFLVWLAALGLERLPRLNRRIPWVAALVCCGALFCWTTWWWWLSRPVAAAPGAVSAAPLDLFSRTGWFKDAARFFGQLPGYEGLTEPGIRGFLQDVFPRDVDKIAAAAARVHGVCGVAALGLLACAAWIGAAPWVRRKRNRLVFWLAAGILATTAQLISHAAPTNRGVHLPDGARSSELHDFLRDAAVRSRDQGGISIARAARIDGVPTGNPIWFPPGEATRLGVRDLNAYTYFDTPSNLPFRELYGDQWITGTGSLLWFPDDARLERPWFDALGIHFWIANRKLEHGGAVVGPLLPTNKRPTAVVHRRKDPLPRAWVVPNLRVAEDLKAVAKEVIKESFLPRREVWATASDAAQLRDAATAPAGRDSPAPIRPEGAPWPTRDLVFHPPEGAQDDGPREANNQLELRVAPGEAGYLVLSDAWMPGWSATVNGEPVPLVRGNVSMRAIPVPARGCRVAFRYTAPGLVAGVWLTAFALILLLAAVVWHLIRVAQSGPGAAGAVAPPGRSDQDFERK